MAAFFQFAIAADFAKTQEQVGLLKRRVENLEGLHAEIGQYLVNAIRNRLYSTKTAPDGTRWADNSEVTKRLKGGSSVLYQSGELISSIRATADSRGAAVVANAPYASVHQNGYSPTKGMIPGKEIPARPFMGISAANRTRIARMVNAHITNNLKPEGPVGIGVVGLGR